MSQALVVGMRYIYRLKGVIDVTELRRQKQLVTQNEISRKAMKTSALDSSYCDYDAISEPACACGIF